MQSWYKLDNAAKLFPTITNTNYSSVFRIAAVLTEDADKEILQKTVDHIWGRFPTLFVRMRKGVFWNYFDTNRDAFIVQEEKDFPCAMINPYQNNGYLLKVLYHGKRISVEVFHSLTDGNGAIEFMKTLLFYYFHFSGHQADSEGKVILTDDPIASEEMDDSFFRYYVPVKQVKESDRGSFHIRGTAFETYGNHVVTGIVSAEEMNRLAKANDATITSYLASLLIYSIYMGRQKHTSNRSPIVITVPVNLRREFPSKTLRNFFGLAHVGMRVDHTTTFSDIVLNVTGQLREKTKRAPLQAFIAKNVAFERPIYSRFVPLFLKKAILAIGSNILSQSRKTMTLSNLGRIPLPTELLPNVKHMELIFYPTPKSPINCGVCSLNDKLAISFSRTVVNADILQYFFHHLAENGSLSTEVYSNDWGKDDE